MPTRPVLMSTGEEKPGLVSSVLNWLRKGYPDGVPPTDYFPLLALLSRRLNQTELDTVVADLTASGHLRAGRSEIIEAVERVAQQEPTDEDVVLVAARLAAAGWPLAGTLDAREIETDKSTDGSPVGGTGANGATGLPGRGPVRPALLESVLGWLRAGYPQGVPQQDYIPLLALLRRRLSDEETVSVAREIVSAGHPPVGDADIGVLITKVTNEMPSENDINRVREQLEAAGWPVVPPSSE